MGRHKRQQVAEAGGFWAQVARFWLLLSWTPSIRHHPGTPTDIFKSQKPVKGAREHCLPAVQPCQVKLGATLPVSTAGLARQPEEVEGCTGPCCEPTRGLHQWEAFTHYHQEKYLDPDKLPHTWTCTNYLP